VISWIQILAHRVHGHQDRPGASRATVSTCQAHRIALDHSLLAAVDETAPALSIPALCQHLFDHFVVKAISGPDVPAGCDAGDSQKLDTLMCAAASLVAALAWHMCCWHPTSYLAPAPDAGHISLHACYLLLTKCPGQFWYALHILACDSNAVGLCS
jgi:hypothetical protein